MRPFKAILSAREGDPKISLHMIGPKERRLLNMLLDTAPELAEPDPDVLHSMLKLGAVRMVKTESDIVQEIPVLTDFGKALWTLCNFQPKD
jgi:hypothetical protein